MRRTSTIIAFAIGVLVSAALGVGSVVAHPAGPVLAGPQGIAAGPDGNVWFTEEFGGRIGRITPAGVITEFPIGRPVPGCDPDIEPCGVRPGGIAAGPDGNLWFTEYNGGRIGRVCIHRYPGQEPMACVITPGAVAPWTDQPSIRPLASVRSAVVKPSVNVA